MVERRWKTDEEIADIASHVKRTHCLNDRDVLALAKELLSGHTGITVGTVQNIDEAIRHAGTEVLLDQEPVRVKMLRVHMSDHNMVDRVLYAPHLDAVNILKDAGRTPEQRMSDLWKLAAEHGKVTSDPRQSQMDSVHIFLSWPSDSQHAMGFLTSQEWLDEFSEAIDAL